jgi:hypothetical protein
VTTKRARNANNANGAVEFLDDGTVQISDKTDRTKKLVLDASQVASGGSVAMATGQQVQDGKVGPSYYFPTVSAWIPMPMSTQYFPGTGDSTWLINMKITSSASPQYFMFFQGAGSDYMALLVPSNGKAQLNQRDATNILTQTQSVVSVNDGKQRTLAVVRNDSGVQFWHNGIAETLQAATKRTPTGVTVAAEISDNGSAPAGGYINRCLMFNYQLSEDKIRKYSAGAKLDFDDIGGNMTNLFTGNDTNFASGVGSWTSPSGSGADFIQSGGSGLLRNTTTTQVIAARNEQSLVAYGKRYRLRFTASSSSYTGTISVVAGTGVESVISNPAMTSSPATYEFVILNNVWADLKLRIVTNGTLASGQNITIDDVILTQLGAVLDLEPESATPSVWHDESGNQLDGTVTGAQLTNLPHFAMTDYGPAVVKQELLDSTRDSHYRINNTTTTYIRVADTDQLTFGNGSADTPFSVLSVASVMDLTKANETLVGKWDELSTFRAEYLFAYAGATGLVKVTLVDLSAGAYATAGMKLTDALPHAHCAVYDGRGGANPCVGVSMYMDGIRQPTTISNSGGVYAAMENTNAPVAIGSVLGASGNYQDNLIGSIYRTIIFNYALDESKVRRYSAGAKLDFEDIGGSMTPINSVAADQTFTSDTGYWTKPGTVTIPGDGKCHFASCLNDNGLGKTSVLTTGKRYRVKFTMSSWSAGAFMYSGNSAYYSVQSVKKDGVAYSGLFADGNGVWEFEITTKNVGLGLYCVGTSTFDIDDLTINQIGAVLDLEPENITDTMWVDASPNGLHGTVSGALANRFVPSYSSRNYVVNGAFDFWQRGSSFTFGSGGMTSFMYTADRWWAYSSDNLGVVVAAVGSTLPTGVATALSFRTTTATSRLFSMSTPLESSVAIPLQGKLVTMSFWYKVVVLPTSGAFRFAFRSATSETKTEGPAIASVLVSNTAWTYVSITGRIPTDSKCIQVGFDGNGANIVANAEIHIANVMLNEGSVAAPFERAGGNIAGELALCQRYYEKSYQVATDPGTPGAWGFYQGATIASTTSQTLYASIDYKVVKRANTAIRYYNFSSGSENSWEGFSPTDSNITLTIDFAGSTGFKAYASAGWTLVADDPVMVKGHWTADAEI